MKFMLWGFWSLIYMFQPRPKDLTAWILMAERTRPPWWKFRPYVWHNDDGYMWHVVFDDEASYTVCGHKLSVELCVGQLSGKIVGLCVWDENLEKAAIRLRAREASAKTAKAAEKTR